MIFPITFLQNIDLSKYAYNSREYSKELAFIECPTCKETKGVYRNLVYICCHKCMNLFFTEDEMLLYLNGEEK